MKTKEKIIRINKFQESVAKCGCSVQELSVASDRLADLFQLKSCPVCGCSLLPHEVRCGHCGWIKGSDCVKQKIKCPYCDKPIEVYLPKPEESTIMEVKVTCDTCKSEVKVPILPKIVIKPI